jgi:hypothetical protein
VIPALIDHLRATQNSDGGWGAVRGRQSNTESTSFATLALSRVGPSAHTPAERGVAWLRQLQHPDGSWPLTATVNTGSWTTALAVTCLASYTNTRSDVQRGAEWLLAHRGRSLGFLASLLHRVVPDRMPVRLNPNLHGWAWTANEFSWVEPTAYALIALKKVGRGESSAAGPAIVEAEAMLYDRACPGGGWNYGNSMVLGTPLPPYPETTAITLIALQNRRDDEQNRVGLQALKRMLGDAASGLGLSWCILCLRIHGDDVSSWLRRLADIHAKTAFLGETKPVALALLAATDGAVAFQFA